VRLLEWPYNVPITEEELKVRLSKIGVSQNELWELMSVEGALSDPGPSFESVANEDEDEIPF